MTMIQLKEKIGYIENIRELYSSLQFYSEQRDFALDKNKKLEIIVHDMAGNEYELKTKEKIAQLLNAWL